MLVPHSQWFIYKNITDKVTKSEPVECFNRKYDFSIRVYWFLNLGGRRYIRQDKTNVLCLDKSWLCHWHDKLSLAKQQKQRFKRFDHELFMCNWTLHWDTIIIYFNYILTNQVMISGEMATSPSEILKGHTNIHKINVWYTSETSLGNQGQSQQIMSDAVAVIHNLLIGIGNRVPVSRSFGCHYIRI